MAKPASRILVINDEHLVLREFVKGLNAAARSLDNPLGISFTGVTTAKEALALIEADGDLQAVLVDDTLYTLVKNGANSNSRKKLQTSALQLVQRITRFRPELDVYILIAQEKEDAVVDALFAESVDGYFYREERDYRGIYRILNAQIQERARTPFYDQLKNYVWMAKDQWHTPGHSSGESLRGSPWVNDFYEFMGEHVFDADLSVSVPMLDSLMEPKGVIAEAQARDPLHQLERRHLQHARAGRAVAFQGVERVVDDHRLDVAVALDRGERFGGGSDAAEGDSERVVEGTRGRVQALDDLAQRERFVFDYQDPAEGF